MSKLLKINEIDEFFDVVNVPNKAINDDIIANIRELNEISEIEPFIRQILHDPSHTPHGPTEEADILTAHVHVHGDKRLSAFILKGKSFQTVKSRDVSDQFLKANDIPGIRLLVFVAVGDIHDNAQHRFIQVAESTDLDYLIIDRIDLARLFIEYQKICPVDGTPYDNKGMCLHGHELDEGLPIEYRVREKVRAEIIKHRDVSHGLAKRYDATILLDKHYPKDVIREIIKEKTDEMKSSNYCRDKRVKAIWGDLNAHVVWLNIASSISDIQNANWICQTSWIDPELDENDRPTELGSDEYFEGIEIKWNENYEPLNEMHEKYRGTKEEILENIESIKKPMFEIADAIISLFKAYKNEETTEKVLIQKMQMLRPKADELYGASGNIPGSPYDCKDYAQAFQSIMATFHNMFFYYTEKEFLGREKRNREWLLEKDIERFYKEIKVLEYEEQKVH